MRCLRCAIEYGPDEQFCQRCGRALSRPLGEKPAAIENSTSSPSEARFFYTTTAPPPLQPGSRGDTENVTWETPTVPVAAPAVWGKSAPKSRGYRTAMREPAADLGLPCSQLAKQRIASAPLLLPYARSPSLPPAKWVDSPTTSGSLPTVDAGSRPACPGRERR